MRRLPGAHLSTLYVTDKARDTNSGFEVCVFRGILCDAVSLSVREMQDDNSVCPRRVVIHRRRCKLLACFPAPQELNETPPRGDGDLI